MNVSKIDDHDITICQDCINLGQLYYVASKSITRTHKLGRSLQWVATLASYATKASKLTLLGTVLSGDIA